MLQFATDLNDQQTRWHWLGEGGLQSSHSASSASGSEYTGQDTVTQPGSCALVMPTDIWKVRQVTLAGRQKNCSAKINCLDSHPVQSPKEKSEKLVACSF